MTMVPQPSSRLSPRHAWPNTPKMNPQVDEVGGAGVFIKFVKEPKMMTQARPCGPGFKALRARVGRQAVMKELGCCEDLKSQAQQFKPKPNPS